MPILPDLSSSHPGYIKPSVRRNCDALYGLIPVPATGETIFVTVEERDDLNGVIGGYFVALKSYELAVDTHINAQQAYDDAVASGVPGQIARAKTYLDATADDRTKRDNGLRTAKGYVISRVDELMREYVTAYRLEHATSWKPVSAGPVDDVLRGMIHNVWPDGRINDIFDIGGRVGGDRRGKPGPGVSGLIGSSGIVPRVGGTLAGSAAVVGRSASPNQQTDPDTSKSSAGDAAGRCGSDRLPAYHRRQPGRQSRQPRSCA